MRKGRASPRGVNKWLAATYLMMSSKKGMSALQISRMIGVTYKTAWFLCHRIRESLRDNTGPLGGDGAYVEVDETYVGGKTRRTNRPEPPEKDPHRQQTCNDQRRHLGD